MQRGQGEMNNPRPKFAYWVKWHWRIVRWLPWGARLWYWADNQIEEWHQSQRGEGKMTQLSNDEMMRASQGKVITLPNELSIWDRNPGQKMGCDKCGEIWFAQGPNQVDCPICGNKYDISQEVK